MSHRAHPTGILNSHLPVMQSRYAETSLLSPTPPSMVPCSARSSEPLSPSSLRYFSMLALCRQNDPSGIQRPTISIESHSLDCLSPGRLGAAQSGLSHPVTAGRHLRRRLLARPRATIPRPKRATEAGSGTGVDSGRVATQVIDEPLVSGVMQDYVVDERTRRGVHGQVLQRKITVGSADDGSYARIGQVGHKIEIRVRAVSGREERPVVVVEVDNHALGGRIRPAHSQKSPSW